MTNSKKEELKKYSIEQLIDIIDRQEKALSIISEICVSESKEHITSSDGVDLIRKELKRIIAKKD